MHTMSYCYPYCDLEQPHINEIHDDNFTTII